MSADKVSRVAHRYGVALCAAAKDDGPKTLERIKADMRQIAVAIDQDKNVARLMQSPRAQIVANALIKVLDLDRLSVRFLNLLAARRRLPVLRRLVDVFMLLADQARGLTRVQVITAVALSKDILSQLQKSLGGEVIVETAVDASIGGGLILRSGSRLYDDSLATKIRFLERRMREDS